MPSLEDEFEQVISETDRILWDSYLASSGLHHSKAGVQIRFPRNRKGDLRVSEQEARFVLTGQLARSTLLYTIETPTSLTYQFTGGFGLSGQTDVSVYKPDGESMWNLEFKAGGFSQERTNPLSIQKDIEKLLREPQPAFWFHTLKGVDRDTLNLAWRAFLADIRTVAQNLSPENVVAKTFVFHACVVRQGFSVEQKLWIDPSKWTIELLPDTPGPAYIVTRSSLTFFEQRDGWKFRRREAI